ncbi:hypothetical protein BH24CHL5_BH24CHL5_08030 [soil metagenome]
MKRTLAPAATALAFAFAAFVFQSAVVPTRVVACSCAPPQSLAQIANEGGATMFAGTVGPQVGTRIPVGVEAWYHGAGADEVVWIQSSELPDGNGGVIIDTCGVSLTAGQRRFFVVYGRPPEPFSTNNCLPNYLLDTDEGQEIVAEAERIFGAPATTPTARPDPPAVTPPTQPGSGLIWVAAAIGAGVLLLGGLFVFARRRPPA